MIVNVLFIGGPEDGKRQPFNANNMPKTLEFLCATPVTWHAAPPDPHIKTLFDKVRYVLFRLDPLTSVGDTHFVYVASDQENDPIGALIRGYR